MVLKLEQLLINTFGLAFFRAAAWLRKYVSFEIISFVFGHTDVTKIL